MGKILYVATVVKTHIMEFHIPYLKMLKEMGWETAVAARNDFDDPADCVIPYCDQYFDIPFERSPFHPGNLEAYRALKRVIDSGWDVIHCHTPVGSVLTRLASGGARKRGTRVLYTAHGFHFYHGAPLRNWLLYYPVECLLAHRTDVLITINREDYARAQKMKAGKTVYIPGVGVDLDRFTKQCGDRGQKRSELGLGRGDFCLLSVGELNPGKNHALVLNALGELRRRGALREIRYVICGRGPLLSALEQQAAALGIGECVHLLGYRNDIHEICAAADLFVFMSRREGLPVALMEAMACGLPVICSDIRGNTDLIRSGENGEIVESSAPALAEAILRLKEDAAARERYGQAAREAVERFALAAVVQKMRELYAAEGVSDAGSGPAACEGRENE